MTATVQVTHPWGIQEASITNGVWTSDDPAFASTCENATWQPPEDRRYEPDPDLAAATRAATALGGEVVGITQGPDLEDVVFGGLP